MSLANMLGTSTWKIRLTNERTIAMIKVTRCDAMTGNTRRHQASV